MKERKIDLIDLFVEILLHWRMLIICFLTSVVLFSIFSYFHSNNTIKNVQTQLTETQLKALLSEEDLQNIDYAIAYETAYLRQKEYLEKSAIMKINPNHICSSEATIAIISDDYQKSCNIEKVYEDIVQSSEFRMKIAETAEMGSVASNELIVLSRGFSGSNKIYSTDSIYNTDNAIDSNTFRITIMYNNESLSKNILDTLVTFLKEKQSNIKDVLGEHEIVVVDQSHGITSDSKIALIQNLMLSDFATTKKELSSIKDILSDTERQYYDLLTNKNSIAENILSSESAVAQGTNIKYILVGAVLVVLFYITILFILYIFNTKIRATDNMQELYEIPQLGIVPTEKDSKKAFAYIDKRILSLRNRNKRQFTSGEALELSCIAVKMAAQKEELHEISLIGCNLKGHSFDICEKIRIQLAEDNIKVHILNNVLYDSQVMNNLGNTKGAVLVESVNSTLYNEVIDELELLKRQRIKVLGGILVEL